MILDTLGSSTFSDFFSADFIIKLVSLKRIPPQCMLSVLVFTFGTGQNYGPELTLDTCHKLLRPLRST